MFSCKNDLQFLGPLMFFTLTRHSNQHRSFSTNYLQFMDSLCATCIFLTGQLTSNILWGCIRRTVSEAAKIGANVFPAIVFADFETTIHNKVTTVWPGLEFKASRFRLGQSWWRKIQSLGLSMQYVKKDSEASQFLKKIFGLSFLPPAEVCDCFALEFLTNLLNDKRVEQFCDYLLENCIDADTTFPPPVWSECTASSLRTINACELSHAHFNALFYSAHHEIFVLVSALQKI